MHRRTLIAVALSLAALPSFAFAEANELKTTQSIRIKAPADKVWSYVGDFARIDRWLKVQSSKLVLKTRNEEGAIRELLRGNGTRVREKLVEYNPYAMQLTYTYVDGVVMASDYFATMKVNDLGNGESEMVWVGRYKRLNYWQDPPPAGQDDASVKVFFDTVYKSGLENLKKVVEGASN